MHLRRKPDAKTVSGDVGLSQGREKINLNTEDAAYRTPMLSTAFILASTWRASYVGYDTDSVGVLWGI